jgi:protein-tyrosine-phosphatase
MLMQKKTLLFVCSGNTCRSPLAQVMTSALLAEAGVDDWEVDSAGLAALTSTPASERAIDVAAEQGLDLSQHSSKPLSVQLLEQAQLVLVMTESHKRSLLTAAPQFAAKIHTLKSFAGQSGDVDDPYGGDLHRYREAAGEIHRLITRLVEKIKNS